MASASVPFAAPKALAAKVGAAPVSEKAAAPSSCEPDRYSAVSAGPAVSDADGAQPDEAEMKEAPAAQLAQATLPYE